MSSYPSANTIYLYDANKRTFFFAIWRLFGLMKNKKSKILNLGIMVHCGGGGAGGEGGGMWVHWTFSRRKGYLTYILHAYIPNIPNCNCRKNSLGK